MKQENTSNATSVAMRNENVVLITFDSDEAKQQEAAALAGREKAEETAAGNLKDAREAANGARKTALKFEDQFRVAQYRSARSRAAAGKATPGDAVIIALEELRAQAAPIFAAAAAAVTAIENTDAQKKATKELREEEKTTSISRALREVGEMIDRYNAVLAAYGLELTPDNLTPALVKPENLCPYMLAPTADGLRAAVITSRGPKEITVWNAPRLIQVLKLNKVLTDAAAAAPAAALREYLKAHDATTAATAAVEEAEQQQKTHEERAQTLKRTINNPRTREETRTKARADLEKANTLLTNDAARLDKAQREEAAAMEKENETRRAAAAAIGATAAELDNLLNVHNTRTAAAEKRTAAAVNADGAQKRHTAAAIAAAAADGKKLKATDADELSKYAAAEKKEADDAAALEEAAAAELQKASAAEAEAVAGCIHVTPAQRYAETLTVTCNAMDQARKAKAAAAEAKAKEKEAKTKKDAAADVATAGDVTDAEFIKISAAADEAAAEAQQAKKEEKATKENARTLLDVIAAEAKKVS